MFKRSLALSLLALISGCATVFTGTTQDIHVTAQDATTHQTLSDTHCTIIDASGVKHPLASNPGTVVVSKNKEALQVVCQRAGYQQYTQPINSSFNAVSLLDIFFWPTFFVDMGTGAMQKYPEEYTVEMHQTKRKG